jgi:hypothetical protein
VSPAPEAVKSVVDWLHQQGAATVGTGDHPSRDLNANHFPVLTYAPCDTSIAHNRAEVARNRDAIVAMMPVHRVEAAFAVSLRRFVSPDGTRSRRTVVQRSCR